MPAVLLRISLTTLSRYHMRRNAMQCRAIDEVESGNVPAVLLICRNSTDTAYFQRLRPYPRVLLRRSSAKFKDYDKSPIGFGVVVFCIAKHDCR